MQSGTHHRQKRVVIATNSVAYMLNHRRHLIERLIDEGYYVAVVGGDLPRRRDDLTALGIPVHEIAAVSGRLSLFTDIKMLVQLRRTIAELAPDRVHFFALKSICLGKLALLFTRRTRRPRHIILSFTGLGRIYADDAPLSFAFLRAAFRSVLKMPISGIDERITVETRADREQLLADSGQLSAPIYVTNGTGIETLKPKTERSGDEVRFLFASRFLRGKGVLEFLEVARTLDAEGIAARFMLAGAVVPDDRSSVTQSEVDAFLTLPNLTAIGDVLPDEMTAVFEANDVVCLPTTYGEGIPRTLLEGAAAGCAFIAYEQAGWSETMGAHKDDAGWTVPPGNFDALLDAFRAAAKNPRATRAAGACARQMISRSNVSCEFVQEQYLLAYADAA
ncbi:MAG: glycosyltransferase [Pseudomonadota bacterium]